MNRRLPPILWIAALVLALGLQAVRQPLAVQAQSGITTAVLNQSADPFFGRQIVFWAKIRFSGEPALVQVFLKSQNDEATKSGTASIQGDEVTYVHDLTASPLTAFTKVEYWFGVTYADKTTFVSQKYSFYYEDNRFTWQALHSSPITVHWYDGDLAFGQSVMDIAQTGIQHANELLPLTPDEEMNIYVYASATEMQSTFQMAGMNMVAGHADPGSNVVVVSLPAGPDQLQETQRQVPHELMHILLYQSLGKSYDRLPTWLNEGLASNNELFPNPDYTVILNDAKKKDSLIPLSSLCHGFPTEASSFYQSYAEAQSFVRFLYQQYGKSGLEKLLQNYADGLECDRGAEVALHNSLQRLDMDWQKKALSQNIFGKIIKPLLPWLALLLLALAAPFTLAVNNLLHERSQEKKAASLPKGGEPPKKLRGSYG